MKAIYHSLTRYFLLIFIFLLIFSQDNAQQTNLIATIHIDTTANKLCFGNPYTLTCTYTNADGVLWWKSAQADGIILGPTNSTTIGYNPGVGDLSRLYFCLYVKTTHLDTTKPAFDSIRVGISAQPEPDFSAHLSAPLTVNFEDSTKILLGTIVTWDWYFGDGATSTSQSPQHVYPHTGIFTVKLRAISNAGCEDSIIKIIQLTDSNVGFQDYVSKNITTIYPNPANDKIFIVTGQDVNELIVLDMKGKVMMIINNVKGKTSNEIGISGLSTGVYILRINYKNGKTENFKMIVK